MECYGKNTLKHGTPGGIRTPNPLIRSQMIYPVDLPVRPIGTQIMSFAFKLVNLLLKHPFWW